MQCRDCLPMVLHMGRLYLLLGNLPSWQDIEDTVKHLCNPTWLIGGYILRSMCLPSPFAQHACPAPLHGVSALMPAALALVAVHACAGPGGGGAAHAHPPAGTLPRQRAERRLCQDCAGARCVWFAGMGLCVCACLAACIAACSEVDMFAAKGWACLPQKGRAAGLHHLRVQVSERTWSFAWWARYEALHPLSQHETAQAYAASVCSTCCCVCKLPGLHAARWLCSWWFWWWWCIWVKKLLLQDF